jgi:hypothetical protein
MKQLDIDNNKLTAENLEKCMKEAIEQLKRFVESGWKTYHELMDN